MKRLHQMIWVLLWLVFPAGLWADEVKERAGCHICGMYIDQYQSTAALLVDKSDKTYETCGVACMIRTINDKGGPGAFTKIEVRDWVSKTRIPADQAVYVIGSRLIPDMMPNLIAFRGKEEAEAFIKDNGGQQLNFTQALMSISPMGMTMPARIKTAALAPKGGFMGGVGYMHMTMDRVKLGPDSVNPYDLARRPGQQTAPKQMTSDAEMVMINYGITDNLNLSLGAAYFDKTMETYKKGGQTTETTKNSGFGDIDASFRYNLWHDNYFSKFFTVLVGTSLPTGQFKKEFITMPGLQLGNGSFSFTGGLLFSHRFKDLWFHYQASYTGNLENSDDYRFGSLTRLGAALHYTPTYDLMAGIELDGTYYGKDQYQGSSVDSTGGFRSNLAGVVDWKFLTVLGGNFSLRLSGGVPIYEDLNHYAVGSTEKAKMGGGYFVSFMLNFNRRFLFDW
jgi:nitrous oxide reductase accessory protein NosL